MTWQLTKWKIKNLKKKKTTQPSCLGSWKDDSIFHKCRKGMRKVKYYLVPSNDLVWDLL